MTSSSPQRTPYGAKPVTTTQPVNPFGDRDLGWLLEQLAARGGASDFLIWVPFESADKRWSYQQFGRDVVSIAVGLLREGIAQGDRIGLVMDNDPYFLLFWSAIVSIGGVAVCLNPRSSEDELRYYGDHSALVAVVTQNRYSAAVARAMPDLRWICDIDDCGEMGRMRGDPADFYRRTIDPRSAASIQYTSGTTARPKAVVWSHANCLWGARTNAVHQLLVDSDTYQVQLPLFHTNALSYSFLASLWAGSSIVLQPKFTASRFWEIALKYACTWTSVVTFCMRALADQPAPDEHAFRGWASGSVTPAIGAPGGIGTNGWFGMTETVSHPICTDPGQPALAGSMGLPAPEYSVAVVNEGGQAVEIGGVGELLVHGVRGVSLFTEYLNDEAATRSAFTDDGWLHTGDQVRLNEDGSITFVERDKDMLKVGGENIGAPEIERVLLGVDAVRDVAVVGRPHGMLGEVPVAFVTADGDEDAVLRAVHARCRELLPEFKRPREVRIVASLPRSTLEKVSKSALREALARETANVAGEANSPR